MARFDWHIEEFKRIRTSQGMAVAFAERGAQWCEDLNRELNEAQQARKQPVENGYDYTVASGGSRARLFIVAKTARAQAHEAEHSSILKLMSTANVHDTKVTGKAENPNRKRASGYSIPIKGIDNQGNPITDLNA